MRVLVVTPRYLPNLGGVETHVRELCRRLATAVEVTILTTDPTRMELPHDAIDGVPVERVGAYPRSRDWLIAPGIWRRCGRADVDLIHFHSVATAVPVLGMLAAVTKRKPFVLTFHSGGHTSPTRNRLRPLQWRVLRPLLTRATALVAVSQSEVAMFSKALKMEEHNFQLIRNGSEIPVPDGRSELVPEQAFPVVVSVGRLERYKGHHRLIEAMPELLSRYPDAVLVVVGRGGYQSALEQMIARADLTRSVKLVSFHPSERQDLANLLATADVSALLSDYESYPIVVLEALAVGTPVVGSDTGGFAEMAKNGLIDSVPLKAGPTEIVDALVQAIGRPRGQALSWTWDDCADEVGSLYRRLMEEQRRTCESDGPGRS